MIAFIPLLLVVLVALASAQQWSLDSSTMSSTLVGCGAGAANIAIGAASKSGVGAVVDLYAGGVNWNQESGLVQAGLLMDGAISADGTTSFITSMFSVLVSTDSSATYTAVPGVGGPMQDAQMFNNGQGLAGIGTMAVLPSSGLAPGSVSGVLVSQDGAATWNAYQVLDETNCRYGAFPTASTWYVAAGMWNSTSVSDAPYHLDAQTAGFRLSKRVHIGSKTNMHVKSASTHRKGKGKGKGGEADSTTGWYGSIYKTTDAGQTFTNVYSSPPDSVFYFNHISCGSESVCIAAAEGDNADGSPNGAVWLTTDGGANWSQTYFNSAAQCMSAVKMTSATEGWFGVGIKSGRTPATQFFYTSDAGATWVMKQQLDGCLAMDMDFAGGLGVATCISSSGSAMELASYSA